MSSIIIKAGSHEQSGIMELQWTSIIIVSLSAVSSDPVISAKWSFTINWLGTNISLPRVKVNTSNLSNLLIK